jgi:hypothetical protein
MNTRIFEKVATRRSLIIFNGLIMPEDFKIVDDIFS